MASNFTKIMNMNLDDKVVYARERALLYRLSLSELKKYVGEMYKIRYEDQDIEIDAYYRLASFVLNQRTKTDSTLIFHMKNFLGALVGMILFRIFIV